MGQWRYLLIKLVSEGKIQKQTFWNSFYNVLMQTFGEYGYIKVDPRVISYDEENLEVILRCDKKWINLVRASLIFLTKISDIPVMAYIAKVSGTLKKLKKLKTSH